MRIYLIRHAHAIDDADGIQQDWERFLTPKGREVSRRVGDKLAEEDVSFTAVLTSPLVRAVQTAEIVAARSGFKGVVEVESVLSGSVWTPDNVAGALKARDADGHFALVGHNPDMELMAAQMVGVPSSRVTFKKGMVCCLSVDGLPFRQPARVEWILQPKGLKLRDAF